MREPGGAVHGQEVEEDGVARPQLVPADVVAVRVRVDVRQFGQAALGEPAGLLLHEGAGHQPRTAVRARHQLQAPVRGHRVHRDPGADAPAVHVVVGLILVPRRALPGAALLDQDVVVVEADPWRGHQRGGQGGHPGVPGQPLDLTNLPPSAEVLGERAGIAGGAGDLGQRPRPGQHRVDRGGGGHHLTGVENRAQAGHAVPGEGRDYLVIKAYGFHSRTVALATLRPEGGTTERQAQRGTRHPGRRQGPRLHPHLANRRTGPAAGPARRTGRRPVLLPQGQHQWLHRRGVRVPRQPRDVHRGRGRCNRGQLRLGGPARRIRQQAPAAVHPAGRPGRPGPEGLRGTRRDGVHPRPGHLRDRPHRHGPARLQLDDQHRRACHRGARGGQAVAGRATRVTRSRRSAPRRGAAGTPWTPCPAGSRRRCR